jgi:hypothetical protein
LKGQRGNFLIALQNVSPPVNHKRPPVSHRLSHCTPARASGEPQKCKALVVSVEMGIEEENCRML